MTRLLAILFLFILSAVHASAQISNVTFIGTAAVKGGPTYAYQLLLTDSAGILSGYSITDINGPDETKTAVKGTINSPKKQITFRETKILSTKSHFNPGDFCFFQGHLKIANNRGITMLKGNFEGFQQDGKTECVSGHIALACAHDVLDKLLNIAHKDTIARIDSAPPKETQVETIYEKDIPPSQIKKLQPGGTLEIIVPSAAVSLDVWDAKTIDGDRITLMQGNTVLLENYTISGRHQTIPITVSEAVETITLIAISEGSEPLNTARIRITSGAQTWYIDASTTIGKNVSFTLRKK